MRAGICLSKKGFLTMWSMKESQIRILILNVISAPKEFFEKSCTDPENFIRGVMTTFWGFFLLLEGAYSPLLFSRGGGLYTLWIRA